MNKSKNIPKKVMNAGMVFELWGWFVVSTPFRVTQSPKSYLFVTSFSILLFQQGETPALKREPYHYQLQPSLLFSLPREHGYSLRVDR